MFKVKINMGHILKKVPESLEFGQFILDQIVLKDSNYYIPKDRGNLEDSSIINSIAGSGKIAWETPYARRLYYNPQYDFSKDKNPNAQGLWFEQAKSSNGKDWISQAQKATESKL